MDPRQNPHQYEEAEKMEEVRSPVRGLEDDVADDDGETYENRDFDHEEAIEDDFYGRDDC